MLQPGTPDLGSVLERCDAVQELLERWQDAFFTGLPDDVDVEEEARWAPRPACRSRRWRRSTTRTTTRTDDETALELDPELVGADHLDVLAELAVPDDDDPRRLLPEDLSPCSSASCCCSPCGCGLEALVAAAEVVSTWTELVADQEKLLGHLVLAHAEPQAVLGHEALVDRHAVLHAASGPGHAPLA
jgi:hypothetical protein